LLNNLCLLPGADVASETGIHISDVRNTLKYLDAVTSPITWYGLLYFLQKLISFIHPLDLFAVLYSACLYCWQVVIAKSPSRQLVGCHNNRRLMALCHVHSFLACSVFIEQIVVQVPRCLFICLGRAWSHGAI